MNFLHQQRYGNKWHEKMKNNNQCESVTQSIQLVFFFDFCRFVCLSVVNTSYFEYLQSIRTRRLIRTRKVQIREVWNNIRSRNRYRFVVSAFVWFWDIDRFIILICRYFRDQDSQQDSQQDSHSRRRIYLFFFFSHIFCFRIYLFTFIAFALNLFAFVTFRLIFESQSTNFFAMSIDRKSDLFASRRSLKKTKR